MPGQASSIKIHENVSYGLQIISSALLYSKMCVDAGVSGRTDQVLVFFKLNMLVGLRVAVFFRKPEIDDVDVVGVAPSPHQKIVRLDISVRIR